jgi:alkylmercury lyase
MSNLPSAAAPVAGPAPTPGSGAAPQPSLQGGGTSARAAMLPPPARAVHRAVLRHFVTTGTPPTAADLAPTAAAAGVDPGAALDLLAARDLVHRRDGGSIEVAYPFSARPTDHEVRLPSGVQVHAMCAIDALGIPLMVDGDAAITSLDPDSRQPIRVQRHGREWSWEPDTAVVLVAWMEGCTSKAAGLCPSVTFHAEAGAARQRLADRPDLTGWVLDQPTAVALAGRSFAGVLG